MAHYQSFWNFSKNLTVREYFLPQSMTSALDWHQSHKVYQPLHLSRQTNTPYESWCKLLHKIPANSVHQSITFLHTEIEWSFFQEVGVFSDMKINQHNYTALTEWKRHDCQLIYMENMAKYDILLWIFTEYFIHTK